MSVNATPPSCPRPQVLTRTLPTGRIYATCLTCREESRRTTHRPIVEQWRRDHARRG